MYILYTILNWGINRSIPKMAVGRVDLQLSGQFINLLSFANYVMADVYCFQLCFVS